MIRSTIVHQVITSRVLNAATHRVCVMYSKLEIDATTHLLGLIARLIYGTRLSSLVRSGSGNGIHTAVDVSDPARRSRMLSRGHPVPCVA